MSTFGRLALDATLAGARVLDSYRRRPDLGVRTKASYRDLVTDADRAAEEAVLGHLREHRAGDAILAEESGEHAGGTRVRWIVDPLDGTTNFVHGRADYAVAVAAEVAGEAVAGAIARPSFGDWIAGDESGADGSAGTPRVSAARHLRESLVSIGVSLNPQRRALTFGLLERVYGEVRDFRRNGSASCEMFDVATGALDAYVGIDTRPWDIWPGWAVVRAAGGRCLTFPTASGRTAYVVGTPAVVEELEPLVRRHA